MTGFFVAFRCFLSRARAPAQYMAHRLPVHVTPAFLRLLMENVNSGMPSLLVARTASLIRVTIVHLADQVFSGAAYAVEMAIQRPRSLELNQESVALAAGFDSHCRTAAAGPVCLVPSAVTFAATHLQCLVPNTLATRAPVAFQHLGNSSPADHTLMRFFHFLHAFSVAQSPASVQPYLLSLMTTLGARHGRSRAAAHAEFIVDSSLALASIQLVGLLADPLFACLSVALLDVHCGCRAADAPPFDSIDADTNQAPIVE